MKDGSARLSVALCVVCAFISAAACIAVAARDAEHRSRYAAAVETIEVMRQEWPNMDAAVQHHEEELERLRGEAKALLKELGRVHDAAQADHEEIARLRDEVSALRDKAAALDGVPARGEPPAEPAR